MLGLPPAALAQRSDGQLSVVVMPFDDLGGHKDDFFADGVVEEITAALSRIKDFFVIARQSAYTYKGRFVAVREVGHDLGVAYAVEGTVRRGGGRVDRKSVVYGQSVSLRVGLGVCRLFYTNTLTTP